MPKRLKWFAHQLRSMSPGNWQIRHRLISAGVALSLLSLATPFYMRTHLADLANTYSWTATNWEVLDRIHEFGRLVTDSESNLRAYTTSGNRAWLATIGTNRTIMDELLDTLWKTAGDKPQRAALLTEATKSYRHWLHDVVDPIIRTSDHANRFTHTLVEEPHAFRIHQLIGELARDIRDDTIVANAAVSNASHKSVIVVTYGGMIFFIGFAALMLSLWFTLMPGLSHLVNAARELKRGNLDYRVNIVGRSETAQLGRAFNEMAVSLKAQNEKLKELNRLKTDFVSTVSHELRTPLTAIKGSIGLILGGVTGDIPTETEEMLRITQKNTDRLIRLINEVLDVAKIEAGAIQMHFDKFSLVDTISHAILGIEAFAHTQGIKLIWEKPQISPLVVIDRDRLEQVMTNLLSNAIKFTEPGGTVSVNCEWENDRVVINVTDTGEGIHEEFLDRIFQKFQQAESAAHKAKEGTGLGLTICKALVEEHGGTIWVQSRVAAGSTFSFSLPWNGTEFVESKKPVISPLARQKRKTILIIDNEPDFTTVLKKLLEHEGYWALTAPDGKTGVELAIKHRPDLVLLDVMMPDMDGFAVRKLLAAAPATQNIPVVFVTISPELQGDLTTDIPVLTKPLVADDFKVWLKTFFTSQKAA